MHKQFDFTRLGGFPLTQDVLAYMQEGYSELSNAFAAVCGPGAHIISGVENMNGIISNGWVVVDGELMPFAGGANSLAHVQVITEKTNLNFQDGNNKNVKEYKYARLSATGTHLFIWFKQLATLSHLSDLMSLRYRQTFIRAYSDGYGYDLSVSNDIGESYRMEGIIKIHAEDITGVSYFDLALPGFDKRFYGEIKTAFYRLKKTGVTYTGLVTIETFQGDSIFRIRAIDAPSDVEAWGVADIILSTSFIS